MSQVQARYHETEGAGASAVRLVVLLYDQMVRDLNRAQQAIEQKDIEGRTAAINHAVWVLGYLHGKLNMSAGGQVARDLDGFYNRLRRMLLDAQVKVSSEILGQVITDVLIVREAWIEVENTETGTTRISAASTDSSSTSPSIPHADWMG